MIITDEFRAANLAHTEEMLLSANILEFAFKRGWDAFDYGEKVPALLTKDQVDKVVKRGKALIKGDNREARKLTSQLFEQGIFLVDKIEMEALVETNAFRKDVAVSPYREGSDFEKEWQRGFNARYFDNVKGK